MESGSGKEGSAPDMLEFTAEVMDKIGMRDLWSSCRPEIRREVTGLVSYDPYYRMYVSMCEAKKGHPHEPTMYDDKIKECRSTLRKLFGRVFRKGMHDQYESMLKLKQKYLKTVEEGRQLGYELKELESKIERESAFEDSEDDGDIYAEMSLSRNLDVPEFRDAKLVIYSRKYNIESLEDAGWACVVLNLERAWLGSSLEKRREVYRYMREEPWFTGFFRDNSFWWKLPGTMDGKRVEREYYAARIREIIGYQEPELEDFSVALDDDSAFQ